MANANSPNRGSRQKARRRQERRAVCERMLAVYNNRQNIGRRLCPITIPIVLTYFAWVKR